MESREFDIELKDVRFAYNGSGPVLEGVSLAVRPREFLAVLGPNGGGKSTLLRVILGLLEPQAGTVRLLGSPPRESVRRVGYVPQDANSNRGFPVSVEDVVLMGRFSGRGARWKAGSEDRRAAEEAMDRMGILFLRRNRIGELSQGQRQRVAIARALAVEPEALLLDEPTASVDLQTQAALHEILKELNRTITIVMVSHDLTALTSCATSVACVNRALFHHDRAELTGEMVQSAYGSCPVELIAHGIPHRVLHRHDGSAAMGEHDHA
ncbi:MAG: metal ABC transporter ATP-binding protein [Synergistales bacterium]|jgi:zinc transport system ATP-binding protein